MATSICRYTTIVCNKLQEQFVSFFVLPLVSKQIVWYHGLQGRGDYEMTRWFTEEIQERARYDPGRSCRRAWHDSAGRFGNRKMRWGQWRELAWDREDTQTIRSAEKGGPPVRQVPVSKSFMEHLKAWREEDKETGCEYLINYHGSPVNSIKRGWGEAKRRAGVTRRGELCSSHCYISGSTSAKYPSTGPCKTIPDPDRDGVLLLCLCMRLPRHHRQPPCGRHDLLL